MNKKMIFLGFGLLLTASVLAQPAQSSTLTMALTGDAIITRKLSVYQEPEFLKMIDLLRGADMAFTNLEMLFHDYEPYPMNQSGGTYMRAEPELVNELVWAGIDMVSCANNHTGDYGAEGMRLTVKYVDQAGLVYAGVGESLPEAREAKFLETGKGRIALISVSSTFPDHSRAGKTRGDMPARPGLSPLRHTVTNHITAEQMSALRQIAGSLGQAAGSGNSLRFLGQRFEVAEQPGVTTQPEKEDLEEIAAVVRSASKLADYTIVTIHAHERNGELSVPAQFVETFARAVIDAGADVMVGHGPHVLRGIELYKGKPILYSLGDFIFQNETLLRLPYENYEPYDLGSDKHVADFNASRYSNDTRGFPVNPEIWESVIAMPSWKDGQLIALELHPISLGFGQKPSTRGRPMLADEATGKKIIQDLIERSKPYGTVIEYVNGIGVVKISQ
jgi:poly-gamma-glutamate synthesis protein (capsule biosynthesis protein)